MYKKHPHTYKQQPELPKLTGAKLRSYAYRLLGRREYGKTEITDKLLQYAASEDEVNQLVDTLIEYNYQNDERYAQQLFRSHVLKGQGPQRIKQKIQQKSVDLELINEQLENTNWLAEAYELKVRKFGKEVSKDQKERAKQVRFLQYRGYDLDIIFKVIDMKSDDDFYY